MEEHLSSMCETLGSIFSHEEKRKEKEKKEEGGRKGGRREGRRKAGKKKMRITEYLETLKINKKNLRILSRLSPSLNPSAEVALAFLRACVITPQKQSELQTDPERRRWCTRIKKKKKKGEDTLFQESSGRCNRVALAWATSFLPWPHWLRRRAGFPAPLIISEETPITVQFIIL